MRTIQQLPSPHNDGVTDDVVLVLTTWPVEADGAPLARVLVEGRLAACVTMLPTHHVVYRWRGRIEEAEERQWLIKTTRAALPALFAAVGAAHPYETPEWVVLTASGGSAAYLQWIRDGTSGGAAGPPGRTT
ncbi:MAG: divalent-cation tolerance protein CutA [Luteitalea sp.]